MPPHRFGPANGDGWTREPFVCGGGGRLLDSGEKIKIENLFSKEVEDVESNENGMVDICFGRDKFDVWIERLN
jgi:hypothetical protein